MRTVSGGVFRLSYTICYLIDAVLACMQRIFQIHFLPHCKYNHDMYEPTADFFYTVVLSLAAACQWQHIHIMLFSVHGVYNLNAVWVVYTVTKVRGCFFGYQTQEGKDKLGLCRAYTLSCPDCLFASLFNEKVWKINGMLTYSLNGWYIRWKISDEVDLVLGNVQEVLIGYLWMMRSDVWKGEYQSVYACVCVCSVV